MATGTIAKESKRTDYTISYGTGYQKLANTKDWAYIRDNEVHIHTEVYINNGTYKAGIYSYPFTVPAALKPSGKIQTACTFFVAGGAAGSARGVIGYCELSTGGGAIVMPLASHTSDTLNCCIIDLVYPLD